MSPDHSRDTDPDSIEERDDCPECEGEGCDQCEGTGEEPPVCAQCRRNFAEWHVFVGKWGICSECEGYR